MRVLRLFFRLYENVVLLFENIVGKKIYLSLNKFYIKINFELGVKL